MNTGFFLGYFFRNWKMILHLMLRTSHVGVNNEMWVKERSIFSKSFLWAVINFRKNYRHMRIRAFSGFIPLNDAIRLFPFYARKKGYKKINID